MSEILVTDDDGFSLLFKDVKPNQVYVDVGAYDGDSVGNALNLHSDLKVIAIEPIGEMAAEIKRKFPKVIVSTTPAWNKSEPHIFYKYQGALNGLSTMKHAMTLLRPAEYTNEMVSTDTLDNILSECGIESVDYLKVDTEGSEEQVLQGFTKHHSGTRFHIEFHITNLANILQQLTEMKAQIEEIRMRRDPVNLIYVIGAVIGHFGRVEIACPKHESIVDRRKWVISHCRTGEQILDVGCADGWIFQGTGLEPFVTSLDIDRYDLPNFIRMDATDLDKSTFKDDEFDVAVLGELLEHVDDPVLVLKGANRVAKRILITVPDPANWIPEYRPYETLEEAIKRTGKTAEQLAKESNPHTRQFYTQDNYKHLYHNRWYSLETLKQHLKEAGISYYKIEQLKYQGWAFFCVEGTKPKIKAEITPKVKVKLKPETDSKLKIGLISTRFFGVPPSGYSGLEMIVWDLASALGELGHEVTLFAPKGSQVPINGKLIETGDALHSVNVDWVKAERDAYEVYKDRLNDLDIIHGNNWFGHEFLAKAKNPQLRCCHTHHGGLNLEYWGRSKPPFKLNLIAISKWMSEIYKAQGFESQFVYNGINLDRYPFQREKSDRLLFVGRIDRFKQPHVAVEVAKKLNMGLDIVGGTFVQDPVYLQQIKNLCDLVEEPSGARYFRQPEGEAIIFYPDASHEKKLELMQNAKCLLFPSQMGEPFGLVACESMATGTLVAALNDGAIDEVVQEGGIVCDVFDKQITPKGAVYNLKRNQVEALADAVGKVNSIKPEDCRKNAERFSREKMAENYVKCYYEILEGSEW